MKDRHLVGMGAAACAVCCAVPILAVLGIAGFAATVATVAFAGLAFGAVVVGASVLALWGRHRHERRAHGDGPAGPVDVEIGPTPSSDSAGAD